MLIAAERLLVKLRQPASRADELNALRARLRAERARPVDAEERGLAEQLRARKLAISAALDAVTSCRSCASEHPWPIGAYSGGACCAGVTSELFDPPELAALAHAGTRAADLTPPPRGEEHAGCTFRGARGCTLEVAHRPGRCLLYLCETLRHELFDRGQLDGIEAQLAELERDMRAYIALHAERVDREIAAPIVAALEASLRR